MKSEAGNVAGWVCTRCLVHFAAAQSLVVVVDKILYHAAGQAVADLLALAEVEYAHDMAAALIRTSRLRVVVEGSSSHPCSSLERSWWIE